MQEFEHSYKREFGFTLEKRKIIVDDIRVRATGRVGPRLEQLVSRSPAYCCVKPTFLTRANASKCNAADVPVHQMRQPEKPE